MNTAKVEQSGTQPIGASSQGQQPALNSNGNGSSTANSIWGFPSQTNGANSTSAGDQQSNKLTSLWSLQWSEGSTNECSVSSAGGAASTPSNPPGNNVWGMGSALEDLISTSNGSNTNGSDKAPGSEARSQQPGTPNEPVSGVKSNWSSAGNPGDSPTAGGGNSGVISPGGSSNGSVSGASASDSKLITQWIGDTSSMAGGDSQPTTVSNNAWGSSTSTINSSSNPGPTTNWGPAVNISSEASGSWQQGSSSQQLQQPVGDQSWNNQAGSRAPRSYSQAATGSSAQGQQGQQQPQQQQPPSSTSQGGNQQSGNMGSTSSPCSPPLIEPFIDTRRDDEMRQMVDNCDGWGQRTVNQETTWDVEDIPEAKPRTDENPNVWPTFVNKGTNGWEESCRRRKVTPGSHHAPPTMASGWGDSHAVKAAPVAAPADAWNKWGSSQTPSSQPAMPWSGQENRMSGSNWTDDNSHRSVASRDESPMGPPTNSSMWPSDQGSAPNNWNRTTMSGIGTWQQSVMSPASTERVSAWTDGIGPWAGNAAAKAKGSSSGDSVSGDFEVEQWNSGGSSKDNDYGEFEDIMLPKSHRWSSASAGQAMPPPGGPQRRIKSQEMNMPSDTGFGQVTPQRSALTENLMQLGVSKDDATKALINSGNDYAQAIRWLVQQGKLAPSILTSPLAMAPRPSAQGDMFGGQSGPMPPGGPYPPGSPNQMPNQQTNLSLQDRIRMAQQRSQMRLTALPPSGNQVIVEQLRKAVHQGYLNQHVLNMQLSQDVLRLIHDLINHQIVLEQVQRDEQQQQVQQMQLMNKLPPMSPHIQAVDQQRQALQHEICRIKLIMEQRKMQIAQRTGTTVTPTPGVPVSGAQSPVGGQPAASGVMPSVSGRQQAMGRSMPPNNEFGQLSLGGANDQQSKLTQWRMQTTPERTGDSRSTPSDNWMPVSSNSGYSPNHMDGRSQSGISGAPAVVEFVPGKPWTGLSMQSTEDDPHMTPASAAKPPLAVGSDTYLDTLAKGVPKAPGQLIGGHPRMSSVPSPAGSSSSPRPAGVQSWGSGNGAGPQQMQYGGKSNTWGGSPWGTGASVPMTGSEMDPGRFLPWGMAAGTSGGGGSASGYNAGNFM